MLRIHNNSIGFWACHIWTEIGKNEKLVASVKSAKVVVCVGFLYDISFVDVFVGFGDYEKTISMPTKNRRFYASTISTSPAWYVVAWIDIYTFKIFGICLLLRNISFVTNEEYLYCLM